MEKMVTTGENTQRGDTTFEAFRQKRYDLTSTRDALDEPIEPGILDTVAVLNTLGFPTYQSCEGHQEVGHGRSTPWVIVYPQEPVEKGWKERPEMRTQVENESHRLKEKLTILLEKFYANHASDRDVQLSVDRQFEYGFILMPDVYRDDEHLEDGLRAERLQLYQNEMNAFTQFLIDILTSA